MDIKEYLHKNIGKKTLGKISKETNKSKKTLNTIKSRLGIKVKNHFQGHDFYSETEFKKELDKLPWKPRNCYINLRDNDFIKVKCKDDYYKFLDKDEYDKWLSFFQNHYHSNYFKSLLPDEYKKRCIKWITSGSIKAIVFEHKRTYKYWINKNEGDRVLNILKNYLSVKQASKKTFYSTHTIRKFIKKKIINDYVIFNNQYWINKNQLINIKLYYIHK